MTNPFKFLIKTIRGLKITPSKEWQEKVLTEIRSLQGERSHKTFTFINPFTMRRLLSGVLTVLIVATAVSYNYIQNTPYAQAKSHLENMSDALEKLQQLSDEKIVAVETTFFPTAYAETSSTTEDQTSTLIQEIDQENDATIEATDEVEEAKDISDLLEELDNLQQEVVDALSNVVEDTENEDLIEVATTVIDNTVASNEVVQKALKETKAIAEDDDKDNDKVKNDLVKKVSDKKQEKQAAKLENAEEIIKNLGMKVEDMTPEMQAKYQKIQEILKACENKDEKCQAGKAKGLATALAAKTENELKHQDEVETEDENEDEDKVKSEVEKDLRETNREKEKDLKEKNKEELKDLKETEDEDESEIEDGNEDEVEAEDENESEIEDEKDTDEVETEDENESEIEDENETEDNNN